MTSRTRVKPVTLTPGGWAILIVVLALLVVLATLLV
jgi:hypothetical protein